MKNKRSPCPVACTLDILGDKWTMLVIRDLFAGKSHYGEFSDSPEKIATNILADRLRKLETEDIVEKYIPAEGARKAAYRLTARGKSLLPVLKALADWGLENVAGTRSYIQIPE